MGRLLPALRVNDQGALGLMRAYRVLGCTRIHEAFEMGNCELIMMDLASI